MKIQLESIGTIHSPFTSLENMPIQPSRAGHVEGEVIIDEQFAEGLKDLDMFSHIYLIYFLHKASRTELLVVPYMDTVKRGVFATRSPLRPSHIGLSIVELISVDGNRLKVRGLDILDGTPLLDIKPFVPRFDNREDAKSGWLKASPDEIEQKRSHDRFV
ncbi:MAG TPA: tRNA (N6-threonylcarbamoyladenosine(37)-N6)-methyltransferase TrmO [Firmicutes bacterium]|nr:tRNA (N6-threonylcarbamoyladenosine(37)-N6)-methyltransferase TrmO [Bacillota bacterium]